jgi:hypothetical protein
VALAGLNLLPSVEPALIDMALAQVAGGGGSELRPRWQHERPKFLAAYSSCALAVNAFCPFLADREIRLRHLLISRARLERRLQIGFGCGAPNLDVYAASAGLVVGVESKCTEYLKTKRSTSAGDFAAIVERRRARAEQPGGAGLEPDPYGRAMTTLGDTSARAMH